MLKTFAQLQIGEKFTFYTHNVIYWVAEIGAGRVYYCDVNATLLEGVQIQSDLTQKVQTVD